MVNDDPKEKAMVSAYSAAADAATAEAAPGKVFRTELNPVDFLHRAAYLYPDRVAVVDGEQRYSYRQLADRSWRLANALRSAGLRKGDRVATLLFNSPAMLEAHFGAPAAGGILVPANHRLGGAEIEYILAHSGARYLLLDSSLEALAGPAERTGVTVIRYTGTGDPEDPYEQFLAGASPERPASWLEDEEETISINYTSGTTGRPKGVQCTYRGAYLNALGEVVHAGLSAGSVYLWTLPMFHCNGWCFPWAVTAVAARHVTIRSVDPGLVWELIDGEGVTHYNGAPTVQLMILGHPRAHRLEAPVTTMVAAAPPSPTLFARMSELNFRVVHVYGLTETYGPITVSPEQEGGGRLPAAQRVQICAAVGVLHSLGPARGAGGVVDRNRFFLVLQPARRHHRGAAGQEFFVRISRATGMRTADHGHASQVQGCGQRLQFGVEEQVTRAAVLEDVPDRGA